MAARAPGLGAGDRGASGLGGEYYHILSCPRITIISGVSPCRDQPPKINNLGGGRLLPGTSTVPSRWFNFNTQELVFPYRLLGTVN